MKRRDRGPAACKQRRVDMDPRWHTGGGLMKMARSRAGIPTTRSSGVCQVVPALAIQAARSLPASPSFTVNLLGSVSAPRGRRVDIPQRFVSAP